MQSWWHSGIMILWGHVVYVYSPFTMPYVWPLFLPQQFRNGSGGKAGLVSNALPHDSAMIDLEVERQWS